LLTRKQPVLLWIQ